jgi:hypothetical protein
MRVPTGLPTHTRARASAVPPRTPARAASTTRPSASRLRWRAARAEKAAHTYSNVVTRAVFHAPMFELNADAMKNACRAEPPAVDADGTRSHVSARMRGRPIEHAHARARTQHVGAFEAVQPHARPYPSLAQVHTYIYVHTMYIYTYICIYTYTYTHIHTDKTPSVRAAIPTHGDARTCARLRLRTHARARIGGPAAHNGPRRIDVPPGASRLRWRAARAGKAAHT